MSAPLDGAGADVADRRRSWLPAILVLVPVFLLLPALRPGHMVYGHDLWDVFAFTQRWVARELAAGRLPTWDPHVLAGFPLLAAVQAAVFYPPTWLGVVLSDAAFWNLVAWLHLALAGLFAEAWLRRGVGVERRAALLGALVFSLGGFVYTHLAAGHVNYVWAYPWGAAVLWRLERALAAPSLRRAVLLAPTLVLMALAGVPQLAFATGLVVVARLAHFVVLDERPLRARLAAAAGAAAALAVGMLLGAPQFLPTLELAGQIQRVAAGQQGFASSFSLPPENLLTLLAPRLFGDSAGSPYWGRWFVWELCAYVGVTTLALAVLGGGPRRQRRFWLVVALVTLLVALGRYTPFFAVFEAVVPGVALFRGPARYLYVFVLALSALAAMAAQRLLAPDASTPRAAARAALIAIAAAVLLGAAALVLWELGGGAWWQGLLARANATRLAEGGFAIALDTPRFRARTHATACIALATGAAWAAAAAALLLAFARGRVRGATAATLFTALIVAELASFDFRFVSGRDVRMLAWPDDVAKVVERELAAPYRLVTVAGARIGDAGRARLAGLDHVGGYEPMQLARYTDLVNVMRGAARDAPVVMALPSEPHPILDMLGARVWLAPPDTAPPPGLRALARASDATILESPRPLPRAWIAGRALTIADAERRLRFLGEGRWDPRTQVVLEQPTDGAGAARGAPGTVELVARAPGEYRLRADSAGGGWLVLAESWYPGWSATVDGEPVEVLRANHLVQAIRLPAGTHDVRFVYRSRLLPWGFALAAAALVVPLALLALRRLVDRRDAQRRDRRSNAAA